MKLEAIIEGLLFVVGEDGLTLQQLEDIIGVTSDMLKEGLTRLRDKYEQDDRGIRINMLGNKMKLTTKKEHKEYYRRLIENPGSNVLSQSALETLAIIAYNQPITRLDVDEIRGISSSQMIRKLVAKGLVKEVGRSDTVGRPILYSTTSEFLDYFGLATLDDLPNMEDFVTPVSSDTDETDLYHSKYSENIDENEITDTEVKDESETKDEVETRVDIRDMTDVNGSVNNYVNINVNADVNSNVNVNTDVDTAINKTDANETETKFESKSIIENGGYRSDDKVQVPVVIPDDVSIFDTVKSNNETVEDVIEEL